MKQGKSKQCTSETLENGIKMLKKSCGHCVRSHIKAPFQEFKVKTPISYPFQINNLKKSDFSLHFPLD